MKDPRAPFSRMKMLSFDVATDVAISPHRGWLAARPMPAGHQGGGGRWHSEEPYLIPSLSFELAVQFRSIFEIFLQSKSSKF